MTPDEFPNLRTAARIETSHVELCYNIWFAAARANVAGKPWFAIYRNAAELQLYAEGRSGGL
jgi:hypothetical protein